MLADITGSVVELTRRAAEDDDEEAPGGFKQEILSSWALFILITLLMIAFFTSYILQQRKITAIHETVVSIFAGMTVGLILRVTDDSIRAIVIFDYQIFFNLLLPPIILSSGYELHQANFFRHIGTILTFAFAGTFLSAIVIGAILWLYTRIPLEGLTMNWVDAISVGATLSATDPVTILAIFNSYKVDPKLYTIIFGEAILNDAVAIVIFESAQKAKEGGTHTMGFLGFLWGIWIFLRDFFGSLAIGAGVGILAALALKHTYLRRYPKIESSMIILVAYATYFFSQAIHMSGIVSLLFCGMTLKHYAYFNMSRRSQLTTKYFFQILAQLSENFIFIYLGLSLFTDNKLQYQPLLIMVTMMAVCVARWVAVFPLSRVINWVIRYRARRRGREAVDELPYNYQAMLFWAGLRGAVGFALAALLTGDDIMALKATVLVVVVLTVIIFGGTTARMLEILGIRTGVVDEIDSDDEFDTEAIGGGSYYKRSNTGIGFIPRSNGRSGSALPLGTIGTAAAGVRRPAGSRSDSGGGPSGWASGHRSPNLAGRPASRGRKVTAQDPGDEFERTELLGPTSGSTTDSDFGSDIDTSDLPPAAPQRRSTPLPSPGAVAAGSSSSNDGVSGVDIEDRAAGGQPITAGAAFRQLFRTDDASALFRQLDEDYIKPKLLLDGGGGGVSGRGGSGNGGAGPS